MPSPLHRHKDNNVASNVYFLFGRIYILDNLQNDLTIDSQEDEPLLSDWRFREDALSILRNTRKPLATQIANSWETVYHKSSN